MNPIAAGDDVIVQQVTINAPAGRIFAALSEPAQLLQWWRHGDRFRLVHAECDLRSGGKWLMRTAKGLAPEQREFVVRGVYLTVDPPRCLAFTWIREEEDHPETIVRWDLEEIGDSTLVRITHSGLVSERLRQRNDGWPLIVQLLQAYVENPDRAGLMPQHSAD